MSTPLLVQGTARALPLKDASVHCCVTSPPYYGLRDYGTGTWQGGDAACTHTRRTSLKESSITTESRPTNTNHEQEGWKGGVCGRCGATRVDTQLGLEASPDAYVAAMAQVFREVWRVLRPDGTLWLNMGDSYAGSWGNYHPHSPPGKHGQRLKETARWNRPAYSSQDFLPPTATVQGIPAKNLLGMPWRLAFALQADGWILRSDIIWDKPSCMPESVQDRPTRSHEYVFLFSKQARYHFDAHAIREPATMRPQRHLTQQPRREGRYGIDAWTKPRILRDTPGIDSHPDGKNARTVWRIPSEPFSGSHFATFPQALVRRCLLAGCPPGGVVFDPFCGSGTTLFVARQLGHHAIGLDLSYSYLHDIARERLGLAALDAWQHGQQAQPVSYGDLPLFGGG